MTSWITWCIYRATVSSFFWFPALLLSTQSNHTLHIIIIAANRLLTMQRISGLNSSMSHMARYKQKDLFFHSLSHSKLNPSGFHTFPLCFATTFCLSLVLPSLLVPLSELHDRVPVYVRRASSQSAVKALILLVAIYYPVVCVKKKTTESELSLGAGCWVSTHAKLQITLQLTYIHVNPSALNCACVGRHSFTLSNVLHGSLHLLEFLTEQQEQRRDDIFFFFVAVEGWNVLVCR